MDKQKQIEEMAKVMAKTIVDELKIDKYWAITIAEVLIKKCYRKIPEGAVVINKDENPCLSCPVPEDIQRDVDCSTICGAVRLGIDWQNQCRVLVKENKQLTKALDEKGKKTAREICGMLDVLDASYKQKRLALSKLKEWIKKNYDLEVK